jgi:hypothetical protein
MRWIFGADAMPAAFATRWPGLRGKAASNIAQGALFVAGRGDMPR